MPSSNKHSLDSFDRNILRIMQDSNRIISDQVAEQVGLSPAAVQRRVKRMREQQIISADVSIVNARALGRTMTLIVQVSLERERVDLIDLFKKEMKQREEVQQCYYVTGSVDFILVVTAFDMEDYEQFTRDAFFDDANVRSFQTHVVMDPVKVGLTVPVEEKQDYDSAATR
jgi:Lrp/AsnC family leucine-responsive transcriptional regulator